MALSLNTGFSTRFLSVGSHLEQPDKQYGFGSDSSLRFKWKWGSCCLDVLSHGAIVPVDHEIPLTCNQVKDSPLAIHKDSSLHPKPLSSNDASALLGSNVRVAYQGIQGAYSEAAALKAYPKCEPVPCDQFEAAFMAVEMCLVDKAVLPIENSLGGSIHHIYDLLLLHRLHIVGEVRLLINHCLLGLPGVCIEEVERALSHPQAFAQCETTLCNLGIARVNVDDTAGAAKTVAAGGSRNTAAVASSRSAEIYGLDIIAEKIQDIPENITRFLILSRDPIMPEPEVSREHKTSIVFTLEQGSGLLFKALAVFTMRGISLSKIESRPRRNSPFQVVDDPIKGSTRYFDYLFYIDLAASLADPRTRNALTHFQEYTTSVRILGSYPVDNTL